MKMLTNIIYLNLIFFLITSCQIEKFDPPNNDEPAEEWKYCIEHIKGAITIKSNLNMQPIQDALVEITYDGWTISGRTSSQGKVNLDLYSVNNGGLINCHNSDEAAYGPHTIDIEVTQSDFYELSDSRDFTCEKIRENYPFKIYKGNFSATLYMSPY